MNEVIQSTDENHDPATAQKWQPLDAMQRRVLGVLVEKAKTTPDSYPITVNAIKTGKNKLKSYRKLCLIQTDLIYCPDIICFYQFDSTDIFQYVAI